MQYFVEVKDILKTSFFLQQKLIHCILPQNVKKVSVILKGDFWMLHRKKKKTNKKAKQKYIHRTLKGERKCVIRERLRRPHPEDL